MPVPSRAATPALVVLTACSLAACSFALSGPHEPVTPRESCNPDSNLPTVDAVTAGALAVLGGYVIYSEMSLPPASDSRTGQSVLVGVPLLVAGGVYGVSALVGFDKVSRCRDTWRKLAVIAD